MQKYINIQIKTALSKEKGCILIKILVESHKHSIWEIKSTLIAHKQTILTLILCVLSDVNVDERQTKFVASILIFKMRVTIQSTFSLHVTLSRENSIS